MPSSEEQSILQLLKRSAMIHMNGCVGSSDTARSQARHQHSCEGLHYLQTLAAAMMTRQDATRWRAKHYALLSCGLPAQFCGNWTAQSALSVLACTQLCRLVNAIRSVSTMELHRGASGTHILEVVTRLQATTWAFEQVL